MQSTSIPTKYLVPFAQNDSAKVAIPVTTTDATRASQSLGFPPLTGQPPEAGGVPPQLEDFNGALNQIAAVAWWMMAGGGFPYDSTFAAATQIAGYPLGAKVPSVDAKGAWISTVEANTVNPDTDTVLTSWVPGHQYGITALTGLTGGTVTLTGAQASKKAITLAGVLTSNLILVMPTWTYDWRITNSTTGAFTVTVKTSAGSGVACTNGGIVTPVIGDGTNIVLQTQTLLVPPATTLTQPVQLAQAQLGFSPAVGGTARMQATAAAAATTTTFTDDEVVVRTAAGQTYALQNFSATLNLSATGLGGMDTGTATASGWLLVYAAYNPATLTSGVFAQMEGSAKASALYSGSSPPSGFTATGLIGIIPISTTAGRFAQFLLNGRRIRFSLVAFTSGSTTSATTTYNAFTVTQIPYSAIRAIGALAVTNAGSGGSSSFIASSSTGIGSFPWSVGVVGAADVGAYPDVDIITPRTLYYYCSSASTSNTVSYAAYLSGYEF